VIGLVKYGATLETKQSFGFGGFSLPKIPGLGKFPGGKIGKKLLDLIKSFIP
jgi:hypothetical protein